MLFAIVVDAVIAYIFAFAIICFISYVFEYLIIKECKFIPENLYKRNDYPDGEEKQ